MDQDPGDAVRRRDELLEFLYWIEGEGFQGAASLEEIARFVASTREQVQATVSELVARGDVAFDATSKQYSLTDAGRREGARRFAEEFAPLLGQGHGECNDPDCDCHENPASAAECHARRLPPAEEA